MQIISNTPCFPRQILEPLILVSATGRKNLWVCCFQKGRAILGKETSITEAIGQEDVCGREASLTAEHNKKQTRSPGSSGTVSVVEHCLESPSEGRECDSVIEPLPIPQ